MKMKPAHFGLGVLVFVISYVIWVVAMAGMLGPWLTPHGEDRTKMAAYRQLKDTLRIGMTADEVKSVIKTYADSYSEVCPGPDPSPSLLCTRPKRPEDYRVVRTFRNASWDGYASWYLFVSAEIQNGVVTRILEAKMA